MRHIRNFFHNINDIILAIIIVAIASGIIYWRLQVILDYPKKMVQQQIEQEEKTQTEANETKTDAEEADTEKSEPDGENDGSETADTDDTE
jgi:F0F1-type ATP synthase membrane subunit b/b'